MSQPTIIVQARMSSSRLPGKMALEVQGKPMLAYVVERLRCVRNVADVIVATSQGAEDDAIASVCDALNCKCFRGSLDDVAGRFVAMIEREGIEAFVRICGDSPLIDPVIVEQAVECFMTGEADVVSNLVERTFPKGQSVEVVRSAAYVSAMADVTESYDREHVTPYLYRHPERFMLQNISMQPNLSDVQLSVDTRQDFDMFREIVAMMDKPHWEYGLAAVLEMREQAVVCGCRA